jgi:hypothetical protein
MKSIGILSTTALFLILGLSLPADARQEQQDKPQKQQQQDKPAAQQQQQHHQQQAQAPKQQQQREQQQAQAPNQQQQRQQQARGQQNQQRQQRQQQNNSAQQPQQQQARGQQNQQRQQRQQQNNSAQQPQQQQARGQQNQQRQQRQQQDNSSAQQRSPAQVRVQQVAWRGDRARSWQSEHRTWQQRGGYNGYRVPDDRFRSYYGQNHGFRIYSLQVMYVGGQRRFQYGGYWFSLLDPWPEYWSSDWYNSDDVYVDYYGDGYYLFNRRYPGDRIAISFYLN